MSREVPIRGGSCSLDCLLLNELLNFSEPDNKSIQARSSLDLVRLMHGLT